MASAVTTQRLGSRLKISSYDHDPGATAATLVSPDGGTTIRYFDMRDLVAFAAIITPTVMTGDITLFEIVAATDVAFTTPVVVKASAVVALDAADDSTFLECVAEEVSTLGANLRYIAGRVTNATATDEAVVTYIGELRNPQDAGTTVTVQA